MSAVDDPAAGAEPPSDVLDVIRDVLLADEEDNMCATVESADDADLWVQVTIDAFNAAFPFSEDPLELLFARGCPPPQWVTLVDWQADTYATFTHENATAEELGRFLMQYFVQALGQENPSFEVEIEDLG